MATFYGNIQIANVSSSINWVRARQYTSPEPSSTVTGSVISPTIRVIYEPGLVIGS